MIKESLLRRKIPLLLVLALTFGVLGGLADYFGPAVRVDSCLYSGCELSPYYDSMAAKILAYAPTRMETIRRMRRCLEEFTLEGFPTNAELSYQILYHPEFILGECTTAFLDEHLSELLEFSRKLSESGVDA